MRADPLGALERASRQRAPALLRRARGRCRRRAARASRTDGVEVEQHVGERVVDLVRHAGGERAERGEPLRLGDAGRLELALAAAQDVLDRVQQGARIDRLGQVEVGVHRGGGRAVIPRDHHDRRVGQRRVALQLGAELPAIHDRQHEIEDDQVGPRLPQLLQCLAPVARGQHLVTAQRERLLHRLAQLGVVLDHQDAAALHARIAPPHIPQNRGRSRSVGFRIVGVAIRGNDAHRAEHGAP